jgi:hypothetical protein
LASQPIDSGLQQILSCVTQQTASISKAACPAAPEHTPQQASLQAAINAANFSIPYAAQNAGADFNQALLAFNAFQNAQYSASKASWNHETCAPARFAESNVALPIRSLPYNDALWNAGSLVSMTNPYAMSNVNCSSPFAALSAMPPILGSSAYNPNLLLNQSLASSLQNVYSQFPLNWTSARTNHGAGPWPQMAWNGYNGVSMPTDSTYQTFGRS